MFAKKCVEPSETSLMPLVSVADRTQNAEAMVISFAVENNMALSAVPKIVDLAKALAKDKLALQNMACSSVMSSYKLKFGVAGTFHQELLEELKVSIFSLNIDEAMNSNNQKIVTVLVSHFSESQQMITVNHLTSFSSTKITSEILFKKLEGIFEESGLPWSNLLSVMMDSCAVMRGKKGGLETLIRTRKAPHLLDVYGDTCHHAHIAAKAVCEPFEQHVEKLLNDLHTDHKWSTHSHDLLAGICLSLDISPSSPKKHLSHRWLSLVQVVADTIRIMDALVIYYYSFLDQLDKKLYEDSLTRIFEKRNVKKRDKSSH